MTKPFFFTGLLMLMACPTPPTPNNSPNSTPGSNVAPTPGGNNQGPNNGPNNGANKRKVIIQQTIVTVYKSGKPQA